MKHTPGKIMLKVKHAGFVGEELFVRVPDPNHWDADFFGSFESNMEKCCFFCKDPECIEFANVEVVDENGKHQGWAVHINECQMVEIKKS